MSGISDMMHSHSDEEICSMPTTVNRTGQATNDRPIISILRVAASSHSHLAFSYDVPTHCTGLDPPISQIFSPVGIQEFRRARVNPSGVLGSAGKPWTGSIPFDPILVTAAAEWKPENRGASRDPVRTAMDCSLRDARGFLRGKMGLSRRERVRDSAPTSRLGLIHVTYRHAFPSHFFSCGSDFLQAAHRRLQLHPRNHHGPPTFC